MHRCRATSSTRIACGSVLLSLHLPLGTGHRGFYATEAISLPLALFKLQATGPQRVRVSKRLRVSALHLPEKSFLQLVLDSIVTAKKLLLSLLSCLLLREALPRVTRLEGICSHSVSLIKQLQTILRGENVNFAETGGDWFETRRHIDLSFSEMLGNWPNPF